ncbi:MAG: helix-turn-helix domain-containing protein [Candidatus Tectimicrobiota bacterium]
MRRKIPTIHESADTLKARWNTEHEPRKQQRIFMLYLLQARHAKTMQDVAEQLHVHRVTIGYWLRVYEQEGLEGLLRINPRPGRPLSLSQPVLDQLKLYLEIPGYFKSYKEVHAWLCETFHIDISYKAVHKIVRYVLKTQLTPHRALTTSEDQETGAWEQVENEDFYSVSV